MSAFQMFAVLLTVYLIGLVGIGFYFNGRQRSVTDFWLAGRKIGAVNTAFSAAARRMTFGCRPNRGTPRPRPPPRARDGLPATGGAAWITAGAIAAVKVS